MGVTYHDILKIKLLYFVRIVILYLFDITYLMFELPQPVQCFKQCMIRVKELINYIDGVHQVSLGKIERVSFNDRLQVAEALPKYGSLQLKLADSPVLLVARKRLRWT